MIIFSLLSQALGWILYQLNSLVGNYGFAIILFTILVRACLFPLTMKQLRSTAKMQEMQPKINALQKKYANDKERFAQEQMKLYKEAGTSPFSGCLPSLIQMPILFCLYYALMYPLENQLWIDKSLFSPEHIAINWDLFTGVSKEVVESINNGIADLGNSGYSQLNWVVTAVKNGITSFNVDGVQQVLNFDFNFLGIDLGKIASLDHISDGTLWEFWPNYVLSLLAGGMTFVSMKLSNINAQKRKDQTPANKADENPAAGMGSTMQYLMPFMTLWFTTFVPTAMTLYWTVGNLIQIVQQIVTNSILKKEKKAAQERLAQKKADSERRRQLFAEEKVTASLNNTSKKKLKRLKEAQKEKDHKERLERRNNSDVEE